MSTCSTLKTRIIQRIIRRIPASNCLSSKSHQKQALSKLNNFPPERWTRTCFIESNDSPKIGTSRGRGTDIQLLKRKRFDLYCRMLRKYLDRHWKLRLRVVWKNRQLSLRNSVLRKYAARLQGIWKCQKQNIYRIHPSPSTSTWETKGVKIKRDPAAARLHEENQNWLHEERSFRLTSASQNMDRHSCWTWRNLPASSESADKYVALCQFIACYFYFWFIGVQTRGFAKAKLVFLFNACPLVEENEPSCPQHAREISSRVKTENMRLYATIILYGLPGGSYA